MKQITLRLTEQIYDDLLDLQGQLDRSISYLCVQALEAGLDEVKATVQPRVIPKASVPKPPVKVVQEKRELPKGPVPENPARAVERQQTISSLKGSLHRAEVEYRGKS